ncbi:MAG TPA: ornithine cyclodeaminase family protein [Stellaceae bacterium]|jgi:ornithine cyclodeaminase|nr:ornithine cyclodeaminase family protein [Stellaceae bacterium]
MRVLGYDATVAALEFPPLVEALRQAFRKTDFETPAADLHTLAVPGEASGSLIVLPAWLPGKSFGVRLTTNFPGNATRGKPVRSGGYLLGDGKTGEILAMFDGPALTLRRTAAASALAATYLARAESERMLMIGTGALAPHLIAAHASVRPIHSVLVWGRDPGKAARLAQRMTRRNLKVEAATDLEKAAQGADIICCATAAREPILKGAWLPEGVHVDLVGGRTPHMREADDEVMMRSRIFVDVREACEQQAGDIVQPMESGVITSFDITGDLFELTRGDRAGRRFHNQITLFKSVGHALEDLTGAQVALDNSING